MKRFLRTIFSASRWILAAGLAAAAIYAGGACGNDACENAATHKQNCLKEREDAGAGTETATSTVDCSGATECDAVLRPRLRLRRDHRVLYGRPRRQPARRLPHQVREGHDPLTAGPPSSRTHCGTGVGAWQTLRQAKMALALSGSPRTARRPRRRPRRRRRPRGSPRRSRRRRSRRRWSRSRSAGRRRNRGADALDLAVLGADAGRCCSRSAIAPAVAAIEPGDEPPRLSTPRQHRAHLLQPSARARTRHDEPPHWVKQSASGSPAGFPATRSRITEQSNWL